MCIVTSLSPAASLAQLYRRQAYEAIDSVSDLGARAWVLELTGIYSMTIGEWNQAREDLEQAVELAHRIGDWRRWEESLSALSQWNYFQGNLTRCVDQSQQVWSLARQRGDDQAQIWGLSGHAVGAMRLGQRDEARDLSETASSLAERNAGISEVIWATGSLAVVRWRRGLASAAREAAEEATRRIAQSRPTAYYTLEGYASVAEVYLADWETSNDRNPTKRAAIASLSWNACKALHKFARVFPIGQPRAWLLQGSANWLSGKPTKAHDAWRKSLAAAERFTMPYEEGRAHYEIGRHLPTNDPARRLHLARAIEIFTRLEADDDRERARAAGA
jgi:tetratricopeptide (TPR) repeat protein